jgi:glycosyltransferase involved in cell wall biosynthesis
VRKTWLLIEKKIFPKLKDVITVNNSIAEFYKERYGKDVKVIRNVPVTRYYKVEKSRQELNLPPDKKIILLQGAGINIQRGAEEVVEAMQYIDNAILMIIGGGDVYPELKRIVGVRNLGQKVIILDKMPFDKLYEYTVHADIGLSIDKDTNINYRYSLPNKLFDYIQARVPVLASQLPEITHIIKKHNVGTFIDNHDPRHIAERMLSMLEDNEQMMIWKENLKFASEELVWENEKKVLVDILKPYAG